MGPNDTLGLQLLANALARLNKKRLGPCPHIEVDQDPPPPRGSFTTTSLWGWLELSLGGGFAPTGTAPPAPAGRCLRATMNFSLGLL